MDHWDAVTLKIRLFLFLLKMFIGPPRAGAPILSFQLSVPVVSTSCYSFGCSYRHLPVRLLLSLSLVLFGSLFFTLHCSPCDLFILASLRIDQTTIIIPSNSHISLFLFYFPLQSPPTLFVRSFASSTFFFFDCSSATFLLDFPGNQTEDGLNTRGQPLKIIYILQ